LQKDAQETQVGQAEFSQPLCTAVQIIIVNLLRRWGIEPAAVVGHSSGEIAASYASGALTMEDAIVCSYLRGLVTKQQKRRGAMAAIGLGRDAVQRYLVEGTVVACENSPASVTLSGDEDKIDLVIQAIKDSEEGVLARRLKVEMAYHSSELRSGT
jgi:acyl transferase domain-containing protein